MKYGEEKFANLKMLMKTASSRHFGILHSKLEVWLFAVIGGLTAGVAGFHVWSQPLVVYLTSIVSSVIFVLSLLSIYRMAVPFAMPILYTDMLRIGRPFYVWMYCVFFIVCISEPFLIMVFDPYVGTLPVALTALAASQVMEYFRKGSWWRLEMAFMVAGAAVGLSAFGLLAPIMVVSFAFMLRRRLFVEFGNGDWLVDEFAERILNRMSDPYARMMERMISLGCFFAGVLVVVTVRMFRVGTLSGAFNRVWLSGLSMDGIVVVVAVGVIPLTFALSSLGKATDQVEFSRFGNQLKYVLVSCITIVFLLLGEMIFVKTHVPVAADFRYWLLGMSFSGFALLLSATVALVGIWCRMPRMDSQFVVKKGDLLPRFCRMMFIAMPIVIVLIAICVRFYFREWH